MFFNVSLKEEHLENQSCQAQTREVISVLGESIHIKEQVLVTV